MNSIFFTVITLLLLTAGVLLLMQEFNKTKVSKDVSEPPQPELMSKEEGRSFLRIDERRDAGLVLASKSRIYRFPPCDN